MNGITASSVCVWLAIVCFFLSAAGVPTPRVNLVALGLLLWLLSTRIK